MRAKFSAISSAAAAATAPRRRQAGRRTRRSACTPTKPTAARATMFSRSASSVGAASGSRL
jgi:hypothetical protein